MFSAASEGFTKAKYQQHDIPSLKTFEPVVKIAREEGLKVRGYVSCVLGCPYEGTIRPSAVASVDKALFDIGCYEISLGDTIGVGNLVPLSPWSAQSRSRYRWRILRHIFMTRIWTSSRQPPRGTSRRHLRRRQCRGWAQSCPYAKSATGNVATEDVLYMLAGLGVHTGVDHCKRLWKRARLSREMPRKTVKFPRSNSLWSALGVRVSFHYKEILNTALVDGTVGAGERALIDQYRLRHNVGDEEHNMALKALGWTSAQYERGYK